MRTNPIFQNLNLIDWLADSTMGNDRVASLSFNRASEMNLTEELFQEITANINIVGASESRPADRRAPRLKFNTQIGVMNWNDPSNTFSVRVADLSVGGAGILHTSRLSLDDQLVICLPKNNDETVSVLCKVMYWEPLAENLFAMGTRFERIVDESELSEIQSAPAQPISTGILARISHTFIRPRKIA